MVLCTGPSVPSVEALVLTPNMTLSFSTTVNVSDCKTIRYTLSRLYSCLTFLKYCSKSVQFHPVAPRVSNTTIFFSIITIREGFSYHCILLHDLWSHFSFIFPTSLRSFLPGKLHKIELWNKVRRWMLCSTWNAYSARTSESFPSNEKLKLVRVNFKMAPPWEVHGAVVCRRLRWWRKGPIKFRVPHVPEWKAYWDMIQYDIPGRVKRLIPGTMVSARSDTYSPASRTHTRSAGFSVKRAAKTRPAVPPPMIM